MKIFFDTEFTGLHKDTSLISIGLVSEDGREFYGEIEGIDVAAQDEWLQQNVFANTICYGEKDIDNIIERSSYFVGTKDVIAKYLKTWLSQFDDVLLVSDVSHYDFVLFIDLFGGAFDLPENVCPSCHDINQDIASYYFIEEKDAFDFSREQILNDNGIFVSGDKHNAIYDARVIKAIFDMING